MSTINSGLGVAAQRALDEKSTKIVDNKSVPYATVAEAKTAVASTRRHIGLVVNVAGALWIWKTGITDNDLIPYFPTNSYVASLSQATTAAPTAASVPINTLPAAVVLARTGTGVYTITSTGSFVANKTHIPTMNQTLQAAGKYVQMVRTSADVVTITVKLIADNTAADLQLVDQLPVEIHVYN